MEAEALMVCSREMWGVNDRLEFGVYFSLASIWHFTVFKLLRNLSFDISVDKHKLF
jgi:hypothetical protein